MLILSCDNETYQADKKNINLLFRFVTSNKIANKEYYIELLELITDAFNDEQEGIEIIFNQLQGMSRNLFANDAESKEYKIFTIGLLTLLGFE